MSETAEARLKRMQMRSWRRGTKEMDLVLGPYAEVHLAAMDADTLDLYDALLAENDQDLLPWVLGQQPAPERFAALIGHIGDYARRRLQPGR
ncbi:MAG: succinate dehydrogenase assembly factor 2 [Rhodobacterales bacterium 65-51]|uniref:FAD assembly factor SdhE n=1 Tax=uncultured Gemmobacter sp. TaxID=1095917 RepID=UPI00095D289B|nr:succinate dehydrogenase assembly factor 2 [uncultured Gemmobacter sp.]OJY32690.1 MAG: succinate dehydrogenase assembly factor 2 [Rhodobacterales bacterium 65-51]